MRSRADALVNRVRKPRNWENHQQHLAQGAHLPTPFSQLQFSPKSATLIEFRAERDHSAGTQL